MVEVSFESTHTMAQAEFATWVEQRVCLDPNHYELLNGRIVMNPPAGYPHGSVESRIVRVLGSFVAEHGLGEVLGSSQGFELPEGDTVEPDVSFVSRARWDAMDPPREGEFLKVVPDLVVEILSASTRLRDSGEKKAIYERNEVGEYWLADPRDRQLTVFLSRDGHFDSGRVLTEDQAWESLVLPGLTCRVEDVFPRRQSR